jgi:hypothetical protein
MLRRRPLPVDLLEDLGHLSFDKGFPGGDSVRNYWTEVVGKHYGV